MKRLLSLASALALSLAALFAPAALARSWGGWSDTTARTVGASSTQYAYLLGPGAAFSSTESARQRTAPGDAYISNLYVTTISAQPATGSLVCTVRVNGADTDANGNANHTVTIAANAAAGTFQGTQGGSMKVGQGGAVDLKCVNNASGSSAGISDVLFLIN